jgi:hypothetical protein
VWNTRRPTRGNPATISRANPGKGRTLAVRVFDRDAGRVQTAPSSLSSDHSIFATSLRLCPVMISSRATAHLAGDNRPAANQTARSSLSGQHAVTGLLARERFAAWSGPGTGQLALLKPFPHGFQVREGAVGDHSGSEWGNHALNFGSTDAGDRQIGYGCANFLQSPVSQVRKRSTLGSLR